MSCMRRLGEITYMSVKVGGLVAVTVVSVCLRQPPVLLETLAGGKKINDSFSLKFLQNNSTPCCLCSTFGSRPALYNSFTLNQFDVSTELSQLVSK